MIDIKDKLTKLSEKLSQAKSSSCINVNSKEYNDYLLKAIELETFAVSLFYLKKLIYFSNIKI